MLRRLLPAVLAVALLAPSAAAARAGVEGSSSGAGTQLDEMVAPNGPATRSSSPASKAFDNGLQGFREALLPFDPGTQSHPGACSRETRDVRQAVNNFGANGVLASFAELLGIHGPSSALAAQMDKRLVLAAVQGKVVTENHGCDGEGHWFAVGPRTLPAGQRVGVKVSSRLRARLCAHASRRCKPVILSAHVVFPINCWNPNMGSVKVRIYVRKPPAKAPKGSKEAHKPKHHPAKMPPATPAPSVVPPPTPAPSAVATLNCGAGGVVVKLSNASTATATARFEVDGASYGPLAPGASETVTVPLALGASTTITVSSEGTILIAGQSLSNSCASDPRAAVNPADCLSSGDGGLTLEYEVWLQNGREASLPAYFVVEWTSSSGKHETAEFGPLAPGAEVTTPLWIEWSWQSEEAIDVTVSSEGRVIFTEEVNPADVCDVG